MNSEIVEKLNQLNRDFYSITSKSFDNSRQYSWKGWENLLEFVPERRPLRILDIGCGNGRFYEFLMKSSLSVEYVGVDFSRELLDFAKSRYPEAKFIQKDILELRENDFGSLKFDLIVSFGVFHHIPSYEARLSLLKFMKSSLSSEGLVAISLWEFAKSVRYTKRFVDWSEIDLSKDDVEEGDYLLDWKRGARAIRFCHDYSDSEVERLVSDSGLSIESEFCADGKSLRMNRYLILGMH